MVGPDSALEWQCLKGARRDYSLVLGVWEILWEYKGRWWQGCTGDREDSCRAHP